LGISLEKDSQFCDIKLSRGEICVANLKAPLQMVIMVLKWAICKKWVSAKWPKMGRFQKIFGQN
jgi:hypothetical protein